MRARSWMAALALIAGTSVAVGRAMSAASPIEDSGQEQARQVEPPNAGGQPSKPTQWPDAGTACTADPPNAGKQPSKPKPAEDPIKAVLLNLEIAGLGHEGCDVEVAPGNPSCKFRVANMTRDGGKLVRGKDGVQHVSSIGQAILELQNVELRCAVRKW
jgi:hypothetical protein